MKNKKRISILLMGGLGNQVFQLVKAQQLKDLGFEMMEDILPAGYDDMPTLQKIDAIVATVAKGREFVRDFYFDHLEEIEHNYELVNSTRVEDLIVQKIKATIN